MEGWTLRVVSPIEYTVSPGSKFFSGKTATAARVEESPRPDGKISPGEYGGAEVAGGFVVLAERGQPARPTHFRVAYDERSLYVAVVAEETETDGLGAVVEEGDGPLHEDDSIEVFVAPERRGGCCYQFVCNTRGVRGEALGGPQRGLFGDASWDGHWSVGVEVHEKRYVAELAIPFATLGVGAPTPGTTWRLNVCRSRQSEGKTGNGELSEWCQTYRTFHAPQRFGVLEFE
jgi:hypothetical protein